nr:hypothetical protein [Tanacetum cinerariifolium]
MAYVKPQLPKVQRGLQTIHAFGKSEENKMDVMKRAKATYRDENKSIPFVQDDAWKILRSHSKWDAPEPVHLTEGDVPGVGNDDLFGEDARQRPSGLDKSKRPVKKPNSLPQRAPREALKEEQHGQFVKVKSNEAKIKHDIDVSETINIELEHKVAKSRKENETLKRHYKELSCSINTTRAKTIEHITSLIAQNAEFKDQLQEKGFAIAALKNELRKLTRNSVNTNNAQIEYVLGALFILFY